MVDVLQARNRNRTDDLSLTTRALPAAAALRAKKAQWLVEDSNLVLSGFSRALCLLS
jgi:chromatin segregation and condensation protein Rec8/ScpA/Scc1 (kleisin family)